MISFRIKNKFGEEIDTLIEGNMNANKNLLFVHGLGVDKDESGNYFVDVSNALTSNFRIVRFDFTGYGKSQGKQEEADYKKHSLDIQTILNWIKQKFSSNTYILAHSMGTFVVSLLSPSDIIKTVFTGIPNSDTTFIFEHLKKRIESRPGGKVDENGITIFPRTSGEIQKYGPNFWRVMKEFNPVKSITEFAKKTHLLIIHPKQDDVVGGEFMDEYKKIPG